jgi:hypothetical protein
MTSVLDRRPEQRYCAFLDILGFTALLGAIEGRPQSDEMRHLISALNFMSSEVDEPAYSADLPVYERTPEGLLERELGDPKLTYVSDCIIISTQHSADGLKALCRKASKVWLDLAWDGFFCRGAISEGLLFHHGGIVFGTAYLRALQLEKQAVYPRVVFDSTIIESLGGFPAAFPVCPPTSSRADDGQVYHRYFPRHFFPPYACDWTNYLHRVRCHICKALGSHTGRIRDKYVFLRTEFNFCVDCYRQELEDGLRPISESAEA